MATNANTLRTNDPLTTTKSHIQDNIQALKNLALSDNWQNVATDKFSDNIQSLGTSRFERAAPNLATFDATEPSHLSSDELKAQAAAAQKHMSAYPSDIYELATAVEELAGHNEFAENESAVSPEQRAKYGKRVFGFSIGGGLFAARAMSKPEYGRFSEDCGGKPHRPTAAALLTAAWNCVLEPITDTKKPVFEAAMQAHPWAALRLGLALFSATSTEARVRAKK